MAGVSEDIDDESLKPQRKKKSSSDKKKINKSQLSYTPEWEIKYPWVFCTNPKEGMFCHTCQKCKSWELHLCQCFPLPCICVGSRGEGGMSDWNHAKEMLKKNANSQWHRDAMAQQTASGMSVLELHSSSEFNS